jgi:hypothetical protein
VTKRIPCSPGSTASWRRSVEGELRPAEVVVAHRSAAVAGGRRRRGSRPIAG